MKLVHQHELADLESDRAGHVHRGRALCRVGREVHGPGLFEPAPADQDEGILGITCLAESRRRGPRAAQDDSLVNHDGVVAIDREVPRHELDDLTDGATVDGVLDTSRVIEVRRHAGSPSHRPSS